MANGLVYHDATPKFPGVDLYHYTVSSYYEKIIDSGYLKPFACWAGTVKKAVYFTTETKLIGCVKALRHLVRPFVPIRLKVSEFSLKHRLIDVISWNEYVNNGAYCGAYRFEEINYIDIESGIKSADHIDAYMDGCIPEKEWYLSIKEVPVSYLEPSVYINWEWVGIDRLDEAIAVARKNQELNFKFYL